MAKQELTCDDILKELRAKQYRPIYYLMGEESYYIDLIADYITDNVLNETEKEFNLTVVYGADVDVATIINAAKRYPMMSEHQVVVVKLPLSWIYWELFVRKPACFWGNVAASTRKIRLAI